MQRNVSVVEDLDGNKIVFIHDIRFKGRQAIEWEDVEMYLKQYVGEARIIKSTNDMVYIGADLLLFSTLNDTQFFTLNEAILG